LRDRFPQRKLPLVERGGVLEKLAKLPFPIIDSVWYDCSMSTASYLNRFLEPVTDAFTPETARQFAGLRANAELQAHVDDLARKANDGTITPDEDAEYKALIDAADLIAVLQLKARRFLQKYSA
jgi:hypothetical protein